MFLYEIGCWWWVLLRDYLVFIVLMDFLFVYIYVVYLVIVYVLYKLYCIFFVLLNRIRYLGDIGYVLEGNIKDMVNRVRK